VSTNEAADGLQARPPKASLTVVDSDPVVDLACIVHDLDGSLHLLQSLVFGRLDDLGTVVVRFIVRDGSSKEGGGSTSALKEVGKGSIVKVEVDQVG
jgi:hypothetical protein